MPVKIIDLARGTLESNKEFYQRIAEVSRSWTRQGYKLVNIQFAEQVPWAWIILEKVEGA